MKDLEWSDIYGEGEIVAECDCCGNTERTEFTENYPDYKSFQNELKEKGWMACKIHGELHEFCSEYCRNKYIKENV